MELSILYEDFHCVAVNKPAPLLTQAPPGIPSLEEQVKAWIKVKYQKPGNVYLGIPHRLDRPVSGVILFARNSKAAARIAAQFQNHTIRKTYLALVEGHVPEEMGIWKDALRKIAEESRAEVVPEGSPDAKSAVTGFRVVQRLPDRTLLELSPETGRMHQLRVQSASRGWPILGDVLYGSKQGFGPTAELPRDRIIGLHARRLVFVHPFQKIELQIEAPLPAFWGLSEDGTTIS